MELLVFAHRAEAKSFISEYNFKLIDEQASIFEAHINDRPTLLLLCGEGSINAIQALAYTLGKYQGKISKVINYGVCGALRGNFEIGEVTPIRTCYAQHSFDPQKTEFKSYTCGEKGADLITASERILDEGKRSLLDNFAPLVDREAWGLCMSAKSFKTPIRIFKLVSDYANDANVCDIVKESAKEWSNLMLAHFDSLNKNESTESYTQTSLPLDRSIFHITTGQERILHNLFHALELKGFTKALLLEKADVELISDSKMRPKDKTSIVIEKLNHLLNPLQVELNKQLEEFSKPLKNQNIQTRFDKDLETESIGLSVTIKDENHHAQVIEAIKNIDYAQLKKILNGKLIDVQ